MRFILTIITFINIFLYYSAFAYFDTILEAFAKFDLPLNFLLFLKYFIVFILGFSIGFLIILGMRLKVKRNYFDIKVLFLVGFIPLTALVISYSGIADLIISRIFNSNTTISELYYYFFSRTDIWSIWLGISIGASIRLKLHEKKKYKHQIID
jgi:hypothetical protein